jgi:hypothetical protein
MKWQGRSRGEELPLVRAEEGQKAASETTSNKPAEAEKEDETEDLD